MYVHCSRAVEGTDVLPDPVFRWLVPWWQRGRAVRMMD